jgi:hypothetical protein
MRGKVWQIFSEKNAKQLIKFLKIPKLIKKNQLRRDEKGSELIEISY